jgi:beta-phosphoglucomutase-like phosphatase (HAD superfamily)
VVLTAEDVKKSKPDPETYISSAERLGIEPAYCIVFEDVPKGVEAAANALMHCIVVTTNHRPEEFSIYKNIFKFIRDYRDLTIEEIRTEWEKNRVL